MNKKEGSVVVGMLLALCMGVSALAGEGSSVIQKNERGIIMRAGDALVEIAVVQSDIFRLTVSYNGTTAPSSCFFLNPSLQNVDVQWEQIDRDGFAGVKTAAGELAVNAATGKWHLMNSGGDVMVASEADIGKLRDAGESVGKELVLSAVWGGGTTFKAYCSGGGKPGLLQYTGVTHVGAGGAAIPYYWTTAGYSAFGVSEDEKAPAVWKKSGSDSVQWIFPGKKADLYLMLADNLKDAARAYGRISGYPDVPPRWSFGYLQSRWGWESREYIEDVLHQFRTRKHPVDAFIIDFEWYVSSKYFHKDYSFPIEGLPDFDDFGWNPELFPEPKSQLTEYRQQGLHVVGIRKPRMNNTQLLKDLAAKGWQMYLPDHVYKNEKAKLLYSRGVNFALPEVRDWYAEQLKPLLDAGMAGWWNDEGEGRYDCYYYWTMAQKQALDRYCSGRRLWTISRSFTPGLQRFGVAAWTGDISHSWKEVSATPMKLLNSSLAGMPYYTCDIGGFYPEKDKPKQPKIIARWMQSGVFYPLMRSHSVRSATPNFPWLYGEEAEDVVRKALELRYRLIPYYYSLAHYAQETGIPLMRPLVMEFPDDPAVENLTDQWFMGDGLMAAPILTEQDEREIYLPDDDWYEFQTNKRIKGNRTIKVHAALDEIPVYVRAGTILPLGPVIQHTGELPGGPLEIHVYPGRDATFTLVEDNGITQDYKNGKLRRTTFNWNDATRKLSWKMEGTYDGKDVFKDINVRIFDPADVRELKDTL